LQKKVSSLPTKKREKGHNGKCEERRKARAQKIGKY
jgi:hypothetical protein